MISSKKKFGLDGLTENSGMNFYPGIDLPKRKFILASRKKAVVKIDQIINEVERDIEFHPEKHMTKSRNQQRVRKGTNKTIILSDDNIREVPKQIYSLPENINSIPSVQIDEIKCPPKELQTIVEGNSTMYRPSCSDNPSR
ncbi:MAG: hypothetical protein EZS28_053650, partial [Streblomastix strix]